MKGLWSEGGNFDVSPNEGRIREDVKIPTYKPHRHHKRSSVRSHTLAPTTICDVSHSVCRSPLTDLGHISSVTYVFCHPLWFVCGHRKGILTSPLIHEPVGSGITEGSLPHQPGSGGIPLRRAPPSCIEMYFPCVTFRSYWLLL